VGPSTAEIEHGRGRLLGLLFVVLAGFASLSVVLTALGPDTLASLQLTPGAARWGVLVLTIGFIALVWEKERQYRHWTEVATHQQILIASFENRLRVVEGLLETSDRMNTPLALDDVIEVILESAVDLVGAAGGSIELYEGDKNEVSLSYEYSIDKKSADPERRLSMPLMEGRTMIGWLHISPSKTQSFERATTEALERFVVQAAHAVRKSQALARERAGDAYREAANIVRSRFLATMSHELRKPVGAMRKISKTLSIHWDHLTEHEKVNFITELSDNGHSMEGLLDRLLEAAKLEIENVVVHPVQHDVRRSIRKALMPFLAHSAGRLEVHLPDTELIAEVDPFVVDQTVSILVDNALRCTEGKVFIGARHLHGSLAIAIADEGPGLLGEKLGLVLNPVSWQDDEMKTGDGLALHIVGTLVESHQGDIDVISDEAGTRVCVTLPEQAAGDQIRLEDPDEVIAPAE